MLGLQGTVQSIEQTKHHICNCIGNDPERAPNNSDGVRGLHASVMTKAKARPSPTMHQCPSRSSEIRDPCVWIPTRTKFSCPLGVCVLKSEPVHLVRKAGVGIRTSMHRSWSLYKFARGIMSSRKGMLETVK